VFLEKASTDQIACRDCKIGTGNYMIVENEKFNAANEAQAKSDRRWALALAAAFTSGLLLLLFSSLIGM
jgi:hypothetical protein